MNALTAHFQHTLTAKGYDVDTDRNGRPAIYYGFGYVQSDLLAFAASLDPDKAAARLLSGPKLAAYRRAVDKGAERPRVNLSRSDSSYVDTTEAEADEGWLTEYEAAAMNEFNALVEEDVDDLIAELRREGYALQEAMSPASFDLDAEDGGHYSDKWQAYRRTLRTYKTDRFRVRVELVEDGDFSPYDFGTEHDAEEARALIDTED